MLLYLMSHLNSKMFSAVPPTVSSLKADSFNGSQTLQEKNPLPPLPQGRRPTPQGQSLFVFVTQWVKIDNPCCTYKTKELCTPGDSCLVAQGEALQTVQAVVQQAVAQDWRPLPQTMRKAATFQDSVNALVLDVLMDKVHSPID